MDAATEGDVIVRLYAAATGDSPWTRALEAIRAGIEARAVVLCSQAPGASGVTILGASGLGADSLRAWCAHVGDWHVPMRSGAAQTAGSRLATSVTTGRLQLLQCTMTDEDERGHTDAIHLAAGRHHGDAEFGPEERSALAALAPHVRQAVRVATRLSAASSLRDALQTIGDQVGKGVGVLDVAGRVLFASTILEQIIATADGLMTRSGVLTTSRANAPAFTRLLASVVRGEGGGRLDVIRPSGCPPYALRMVPVPAAAPALGGLQARLSVIVSDPTRSRGPGEVALARSYGLTRAESRMVSHLVGGATVGATAEQLGISLNTARTHLKRAMAKAGVSRQAELVRLLLISQ